MKWRKFWLGALVLVPLCGAGTYAAAGLFSAGVATPSGLAHPPLRSFLIGLGIWFAVFLLVPRPMWFYVFGHELTHAVWTWICGGRVFRFRVTAAGGLVQTDRANFFIALAPYFFPIYSLLVLWLWWLTGFWVRLDSVEWLLFSLLGFTWGFHAAFTALMIPTSQQDITDHGWTFSLSLIYLANLVLILGFLLAISPGAGRRALWDGLAAGFLRFWMDLAQGLSWLATWARNLVP